jgi:glycosyltransferase involved in cell wall biosynthesis
MQIAISVGTGKSESEETKDYFIKRIAEKWIDNHQDHQFYIIYIGEHNEDITIHSNLEVINLPVSAKLPFYEWRRKKKLGSFLQKIRPDIFISFEGSLLDTKDLKQYVFFFQTPLKQPKNIETAKGIITLSGATKQKLIDKYKAREEKILVVYGGGFTKESLNEDEKTSVKEHYSDGKEFFLCPMDYVSQESIVQSLKAFSLFKKRQKTTMRLALIGKVEHKEKFQTSMQTYKYKEEVIVLDDLPSQEQSKLLSSAYAAIYIKEGEENLLTELNIMGQGIPVLTANSSILKEVSDEAALYFDAADTKDIADKMMLIYKDENLRSKLIEEGNRITQQYNWTETAESAWQFMMKK